MSTSTTVKAPKVGDTLANGGIVLAVHGNDEEGYVLCLIRGNGAMQFASWHYFIDRSIANPIVSTGNGHYHPALFAATDEYKRRIGHA